MDEVKDNSKVLKRIIYVLLGIIAFLGILITSLMIYKSLNHKKQPKVEESSGYREDYYATANYERLNNMTIPYAYSSWSIFHDAQLRANTKKEDLIDEILNRKDYSNENMEIMVDLYTDYSARNKRGLTELQPYIDMIDKCKTMEDFNKALIILDHDLNSNAFLSVGVESDLYNSNKNVLSFAPIVVEDNFEIFTLDKYSRYADEYRDYRKKVLKLAGWNQSEIDKFSKEVDEFVEKIQAKSKVLSTITNKLDLYNKFTYEEIENTLVNLPIVDFLKRYSIEDQDYYVFYDMEHYKALDEFFTIENLEFLKKLEKMMLLERVAVNYTTDEFFNLGVDLENKIKGTNLSSYSKKQEFISNLKEESLGEELAKLYEERYFTNEDKEYVNNLVKEIKAYYIDVVKNSDWLDSNTKQEAIKKLESMKVNVGYIKKESNIEEAKYVSKKDGGTLISNYIISSRYTFDKIIDELNMESDGSISVDTFEVNAYYNPLDNSINFTAAFKEIYGKETDYYKLLGYIGTVIGHEISHAFDYTGSKFDEHGNVRDWWSNNDKERYEELTKKIISYYSGYKIGNYSVDGEKTLSENIADLASMNCMMSIMEKKGAKEEDYKHFFEAYADLWASKEKDEALENQILTDTHSPNKIRVNAVLSSTDKFYEIYGVVEGDGMYVPKEDRVGLW